MRLVNLYFFRHGQTNWNLNKIFQGSHDIPLNDTGREQARELSEKINSLPIDIILSSDLSRARETAQIAFADLGLETRYFKELREAHLGEVEGMPRTEFLAKYGNEMWKAWISQKDEHLDFKFPKGETKRETRQRVIDCIEGFIKRYSHEHIAVSTHGGVISRIVHYCEGAPIDPAPIPNGCLYHIQWDHGRWVFKS